MEIAITIKAVSVNFDTERVLSDFNLDINEGEKVVLHGPSGSGKSTLLNAIMGFIPIDAGEITVFGQPILPGQLKEARKNMGYMPQEVGLVHHSLKSAFFSPFDFERNKKLKPSPTAINQLWDIFNLEQSMLNKSMNEISGGQKQRIMLSSVLLLERPLLLLDEPLSALDSKNKENIYKHLFGMENTTIVMVSHDSMALEIADKSILMDKLA